jgi:hypothetical protein
MYHVPGDFTVPCTVELVRKSLRQVRSEVGTVVQVRYLLPLRPGRLVPYDYTQGIIMGHINITGIS